MQTGHRSAAWEWAGISRHLQGYCPLSQVHSKASRWFCQFPKLGGLKQQTCIVSVWGATHLPGHTASEASRGESISCLSQFWRLGIPWLAAA